MMSWIDNVTAATVAMLTANVLPAVILLVAGILAIRIAVKIVITALNKTKLEKAAHSLILSVVRAVLYILLGLMVATKLGIDVTSIVALALLFTLRDMLSFTLLFTRISS